MFMSLRPHFMTVLFCTQALLSIACTATTDTAADATVAQNAQQLYMTTIVDKAQQLFCKILPTELLNELNAAKKSDANVSNYAKIFTKHIQSADPLYSTDPKYETPLKPHNLLANLFHDFQTAVTPMKQHPLIGVASLLEGLSKIYAHETEQQHAKFKYKLNTKIKEMRQELREEHSITSMVYERVFNYFFWVVLKVINAGETGKFFFGGNQNPNLKPAKYCASYDSYGIQDSILACLPVTIFKEIVNTKDFNLTDYEHWHRYLTQCFLFMKLTPNEHFAITNLYFNPNNLGTLTTEEQLILVLIPLFTEFLVLRQYAAIATKIYWKRLILRAKNETLSKYNYCTNTVNWLCDINVYTNDAILPILKED